MERLLQEALAKVKQAEVYRIEEEVLPVAFNGREISRINAKKVVGYSLRVIDKEGRMGLATSTSLDRADLIERAMISAQYGGKSTVKFPNGQLSDVQCYDPTLANLTAREMIEQGMQMVDTIAKFDPTMQVEGSLGKGIERVKIVNSSGLNVSYERTSFSMGVSSRAEDGFREMFDFDMYSKHFTFDDARLQRFVQNHQFSKQRYKVKTGKMDILFNPAAIWPLLYRVFAGANASSILRGISPLKDRLGETMFSPLINIVDDPTYAWGFGTCPFDDEGSVAQRTPIIENGVLRNYLFDLDNASEYGTTSTGNGFKKNMFDKGIDVKASVYPSNLVLLPGEHRFEDMVRSMKRGLIVNQVMGGHTGNVVAGEFGLNIGSGFLVEDGEIKGKVVDAMVSGNIYDLFKQVSMVGNNMRATTAVFYGLGYTPSILVPELTVAGSDE